VFPLRRPSKIRAGARTVLAGKGPLRHAKQRRALACSAPFWPNDGSDGRLRREHFTAASKKEQAGSLLTEESRPDLKKPPSEFGGLDRVAPYQNMHCRPLDNPANVLLSAAKSLGSKVKKGCFSQRRSDV
jgi:hypothetical protein